MHLNFIPVCEWKQQEGCGVAVPGRAVRREPSTGAHSKDCAQSAPLWEELAQLEMSFWFDV